MASKLPPLSFKLKLLQFAGKLLLGVGLLLAFVGRDSLPLFLLPEALTRWLYPGALIPLGLVLLLPVWVSRLRAMAQLVQSNKAEGAAQLRGIAAAAGAAAPDPQKVAALLRQMQKDAASRAGHPAAAAAATSARAAHSAGSPPAPAGRPAVTVLTRGGESAVRRSRASTDLIRR